jgi:molecular chaperone GrpE
MNDRDENNELDPEVSPESDAAEETPSLDDLAQAAAEVEAETGQGDMTDLQTALAQKIAEATEAQDRYLRTYADFENYRKRMQRDMAEFRKYANEQMALDLLTVVDHLGLAIRHTQDAGEAGQALLEGVGLVYKQFLDLLEKYGITPFKAEGEPFDPKLHDAMMQVETAEVPENTVVKVFQEGYRYHEKVLRHARVGVSKHPGETAPSAEAAADENGDGPDTEE